MTTKEETVEVIIEGNFKSEILSRDVSWVHRAEFDGINTICKCGTSLPLKDLKRWFKSWGWKIISIN